jgi:hypothetical protein
MEAQELLDRCEVTIKSQMAEIDRLRAENQRLVDWIMGDADAHTTLQSVYLDPQAPRGDKIKAAAASLPFEKPKLGSTEPPVIRLNVVPLPELLAQRRARQDQLEGKVLDLLPVPSNGKGNGGD